MNPHPTRTTAPRNATNRQRQQREECHDSPNPSTGSETPRRHAVDRRRFRPRCLDSVAARRRADLGCHEPRCKHGCDEHSGREQHTCATVCLRRHLHRRRTGWHGGRTCVEGHPCAGHQRRCLDTRANSHERQSFVSCGASQPALSVCDQRDRQLPGAAHRHGRSVCHRRARRPADAVESPAAVAVGRGSSAPGRVARRARTRGRAVWRRCVQRAAHRAGRQAWQGLGH
jgi:hypothetical protein